MTLGFDRSVTARLKADVSDYVAKMAVATKATNTFLGNLDTSGNRMSNLVQASLALGPALVPIATAAVPAVAGLSAGLLVTAAAGGVVEVAMHGIGTALSAVNKYQVQPTTANLAAMQLALHNVGPAGAEFVHFLSGVEPQLRSIENLTREGLFPGLEGGISELLGLMPEVKDIALTVSTTLGDLAVRGGNDLNSPQWRSFFTYLDTRAKPILSEVYSVLSNVTLGLANMVQAADPLTHTFGEDLVHMAASFEQWSSTLANDPGFQSFVDYVQTETPEVGKTLATLASALLDIVKAAAPVGAVTLPIIRDLATALAAIASSPIGPVLIGAASALSVLSRAVALFKAVNGSAVLGGIGGIPGKAGASTGAAVEPIPLTTVIRRDSIIPYQQALQFTPITLGATKAAGAVSRFNVSAAATGKVMRGAALGVGLLGNALLDKIPPGEQELRGLATVASDAAIGFGVTSSVWGAGIGALVGLLTSAGNQAKYAATAVGTLTSSLNQNTGAVTSNTRSLVAQSLQQGGVLDIARKYGISLSEVTDAAMGNAQALDDIRRRFFAAEGSSVTSAEPVAKDFAIVSSAIGDQTGSLHDAIRGWHEIQAAQGSWSGSSHATTASAAEQSKVMNQLGFAIGQTDAHTRQLTIDQRSLNSVFEKRQGSIAAETLAIEAATSAQKALGNAAIAGGNGIAIQTKAGANLVQNLNQIADASTAVTGSEKIRAAAINRGRAAMVAMMIQSGLNATFAQKYVDKLLAQAQAQGKVTHTPANGKVTLSGADAAMNRMKEIQRELDLITRTYTIHINVLRTGDAIASGIGQISGRAGGGPVTGGVPGRDSVLMLGMPGEWVQRKAAVDYYGQGFMQAINNMQIPRYGDGGFVGIGNSTQTVIIRQDPQISVRLQAIERRLAGELKTAEQHPERIADATKTIARDGIRAYADQSDRLAGVGTGGN